MLRGLGEGFIVYDRRGLNLDVLERKSTGVAFVPQHPLDHMLRGQTALPRYDPAVQEELPELVESRAAYVRAEALPDSFRLWLGDLERPILAALVSDRQGAERDPALLRALSHAADHLLPQVRRAVLSEAFHQALQEDALRAFRDRLLSVEESDAGLP